MPSSYGDALAGAILVAGRGARSAAYSQQYASDEQRRPGTKEPRPIVENCREAPSPAACGVAPPRRTAARLVRLRRRSLHATRIWRLQCAAITGGHQ